MTAQPYSQNKSQPSNITVMRPANNFALPFSEEAEQATLGAVAINFDMFKIIKASPIELDANDFFLTKHGYIWEALERIERRGHGLDILILTEELDSHGHLTTIGGPAYLMQLFNSTPDSTNAPVYAAMVKQSAIRRRMMATADEIKAMALDESRDLGDLMKDADARFGAISEAAARATSDEKPEGLRPISEAIKEQDLRLWKTGELKTYGTPSGIMQLDDMLDGFRRKKLYYIGAYAHVGKSSLLLTIALNAALLRQRVALFTVEDDVEDVVNAMVAMVMGIAPDKLVTGNLTEDEARLYVEVSDRLSRLALFIDGDRNLDPRTMYRRIEKMIDEGGCDLVLVDYIQKLSLPADVMKNVRGDERAKIVYLSDALFKTAAKLNVPIVAAAQTARPPAPSKRNPHPRPNLRDFMGSSMLERDGHIVMMPWRNPNKPWQTELFVLKNKVNGRLGMVNLHFNPITRRFTDWLSDDPHNAQAVRVS